jgi:thiol-disulfide isomerase/thioredoxin
MMRAPQPLLALVLAAAAAHARAGDAPAADAPKDPIPWETSYGDACKKATESGKPLLFKFYTGWCPHCTRMDKTTWLDPGVAKLATSFVAGKVNTDVEKVPVQRYRLVGYPTVVVADPGGDEVLRLEGYKDATAVSAYLKAYLTKAPELKAAFDSLRRDPTDAAAHVKVADFYASVGLDDRAADTYARASKTAQGPVLVAAATGAGSCLVKAGKFKAALKALEPAKAAAGTAPTPALLLALGQAEAGAGNGAAAKGWLDQILSQHAGTPEAEAAKKTLATL